MIREKIPDFACSVSLTHQTFNTLQKKLFGVWKRLHGSYSEQEREQIVVPIVTVCGEWL
jgi:hypothetical protein